MVDKSGSIYNVGHAYWTDDDFDPGSGVTTLPPYVPGVTPAGGVFLQKLTSIKQFNWVKILFSYNGGLGFYPLDASNYGVPIGVYSLPSITMDAAGNFYTFYYRIDDTPTVYLSYCYISKYNSSGDLQWSLKQYVGILISTAAIRVNSAGDVFVSANYNAATKDYLGNNFGPIALPSLTGKGAFIEKLNSAGNVVSYAAINATLGISAITDDGQVFDVTGVYLRKFQANGHQVVNQTLNGHLAGKVLVDNAGNAILWSISGTEIGKFDVHGNLVWHLLNLNNTKRIITDATGNIYVMGTFSGTFDFDPGPGTYNLTTPTSDAALYIQKFDPSGNLLWAKQRAINGITTVSAATATSSYIYINGNAGTNTAYEVKINQCNP